MLLKPPLKTWGPAGDLPAKPRGWKHLVEDDDLEYLERQFEIPRLGDVLGAWTLGNRKQINEVIEHCVGTFLHPELEYLADRYAEAEVFYRYSTKSRDSREEGRVYPTMEAALRTEGGASFEGTLRDGLRFGLTPWCWFYKHDLSAGPHLGTQDKVQLIKFLGAAIKSKPASLNT
jgi:hypothetical protein